MQVTIQITPDVVVVWQVDNDLDCYIGGIVIFNSDNNPM